MTTADVSSLEAENLANQQRVGDGNRLGNEPLISVRDIRKSFATAAGTAPALEDVSLEIRRNEFFTLLGPSGCGKTTLLRVLAGFDRPDAGSLQLNGVSIIDEPPNKRPINMVFQSYALFPHMSVARNVAFGLEQLGMPRRAIEERVGAMLRLVRLEERASRKPSQLSGGQQQRVALARALAPNPKLLLLDEPLSALDRKLRHGMQVELKRMQRETGVTFLLVTHDQDEALSMSDRIAVMDRGRVVQLGTPRSLYEQPRTSFVADFMGANVIPGTLVDRPEKALAIRPERIVLSADAVGLPARVEAVTYLGMTLSVTVAMSDGLRLNVIAKEAPDVGSSIWCRFPVDALWPVET